MQGKKERNTLPVLLPDASAGLMSAGEMESIGMAAFGRRYGWMRYVAGRLGVGESTLRAWKANPERMSRADVIAFRGLRPADEPDTSGRGSELRQALELVTALSAVSAQGLWTLQLMPMGPDGDDVIEMAAPGRETQRFCRSLGWSGAQAFIEKETSNG